MNKSPYRCDRCNRFLTEGPGPMKALVCYQHGVVTHALERADEPVLRGQREPIPVEYQTTATYTANLITWPRVPTWMGRRAT